MEEEDGDHAERARQDDEPEEEEEARVHLLLQVVARLQVDHREEARVQHVHDAAADVDGRIAHKQQHVLAQQEVQLVHRRRARHRRKLH
eukprot:237975-Prymnesium_polylepis.1